MTPEETPRHRRGKEWGILAGIGAATLLLGLVAVGLRPSASMVADDDRRSALRTTPGGVAALYRAIARLGPATAVRVTPLVDADPLRGTLVLLQPARRPSPREVRELLDWVRGGGTVIHAPRGDSPILDSLGLVRRTLIGDEDRRGRFPNDREPAAGGEVSQHDEDASRTPDSADEPGERPLWSVHPLAEGLAKVRPAPARYAIAPDTASGDEDDESGERADDEGAEDEHAENGSGDDDGPPPAPFHPLLLTAPDSVGHRWAAVAFIPLGEGRIIAFADAAPLSNRFVGESPLAVLAARAAIAHTSPGDSVFFDEFSQGLGASRSPARATADFLVGAPAGRASLHAGLVVLLALFCAGLRFGAPSPPPRHAGRSAIEHVAALAAVYESAGARETAAVLLLGRLARASRLPPPRDLADAEGLLARLEQRTARPESVRLIRAGLEANPVDLVLVARGIDHHIQGRTSA